MAKKKATPTKKVAKKKAAKVGGSFIRQIEEEVGPHEAALARGLLAAFPDATVGNLIDAMERFETIDEMLREEVGRDEDMPLAN